MLIVCPNCATSYNIDPASLGAAGRTVRCARCKTAWFAERPGAAPELTASANDGVIAEAKRAALSASYVPMDRVTADYDADAMPASADDGEAASVARRPQPVDAPHPEPVAIADAPSVVPPIEPPAAPLSTARPDPDEARKLRRATQALAGAPR